MAFVTADLAPDAMSHDTTRRRFVGAIGAVTTVALAGCMDSGSGGDGAGGTTDSDADDGMDATPTDDGMDGGNETMDDGMDGGNETMTG